MEKPSNVSVKNQWNKQVHSPLWKIVGEQCSKLHKGGYDIRQ